MSLHFCIPSILDASCFLFISSASYFVAYKPSYVIQHSPTLDTILRTIVPFALLAINLQHLVNICLFDWMSHKVCSTEILTILFIESGVKDFTDDDHITDLLYISHSNC